ncbi:MAG: hypothetical protein ABSE85_12250 [Candidatus Korobacteraceae bacterium]|jgi:hypothetical protein
MKSAKMNFAVNYVKSVATTMALLGWLVSCAAPAASAQDQIGVAVGNSGSLLDTFTGGFSNPNGTGWSEHDHPATLTVDLKSVRVRRKGADVRAWAVGDANGDGATRRFTVLLGTATTDNRTFTWNQIGPTDANATSLNSIYFWDWDWGMAVGAGGKILYSNGHGDGSGWQQPASGTGNALNGVFMIRREVKRLIDDKWTPENLSFAWAVGDGGTILFYNGSDWAAARTVDANGRPADVSDLKFVSVRGYISEVNPKTLIVYAVAASAPNSNKIIWKLSWDIGVGTATTRKGDPNMLTPPPFVQTGYSTSYGTPTALRLPSGPPKFPEFLIGLDPAATGGANVAYYKKGFQDYKDGGLTGKVSDLSATDSSHIWIAVGGNIGYGNGKRWITQTTIAAGATPPGLNSIDINGRGGPGINNVQLGDLTSPESGASDMNYISLTGAGFPEGNINPANVVIELAAECHGAAWATTSAVSVVSGSDDSQLVSFKLPAGLDPGQYFIRISDSEEGDANFESSNCSEVNVVQ